MNAINSMDWLPPSLSLMQALPALSRMAAASVVSGLWQGAALAAGAALCLRLTPKTTAAIRFAVWTAVFAVLALLPLFPAYVGGANRAGSGSAAMLRVDVRWSFLLALLWLTMSLVRGVKLAAGAIRLRAIWKRAQPVDAAAGTVMASCSTGWRSAQLCTSSDVDRPSVIGFFSPRILIPEDLFPHLTPAELGQIVLHEAGHLRRGDDWINLLQKLSLMLVPLNPVLLWIERRLCFERELACDDDVLLRTKAPKAYATCLTNLAEHRLGKFGRQARQARQAAALSLGAWERQSELGRRVHRILHRGKDGGKTMSRMQGRVVLGTLAVALLGGAAEMSRCPQLVAFSGQPLAIAADTQGLSKARYQPVVFHPASPALRNGAGAAHESAGAIHEILLKAYLPAHSVQSTLKPASSLAPRKHSAAVPALLRSKHVHAKAQQWVVLTSWDSGQASAGEIRQTQVIFAVSGQRGFSSYAAVPTQAGWLVLQL